MSRKVFLGMIAAVLVAVGLATGLALALTGGDSGESATGTHTMAGGDVMTGAMEDHAGMLQGTVWVANEGDDSLTAIDAATNEVVATLRGIAGPHNLQVSPNGRNVWAVSGHESMAVMLDGTTYRVHGVVPTGKEPAHVVLTPDGSVAYVTNAADGTVTAVDAARMEALATIAVTVPSSAFVT